MLNIAIFHRAHSFSFFHLTLFATFVLTTSHFLRKFRLQIIKGGWIGLVSGLFLFYFIILLLIFFFFFFCNSISSCLLIKASLLGKNGINSNCCQQPSTK